MTQDELKKLVAQAALKHVVEDGVVGRRAPGSTGEPSSSTRSRR
jgi:hypothetical protein